MISEEFNALKNDELSNINGGNKTYTKAVLSLLGLIQSGVDLVSGFIDGVIGN